ncbi:MAG TPA: hypothetical protein VM940_16815 [Chthoniobacterales bacterium]|jgi:hypothetical protein|nr:hypothetical protein [Chthoniobacterales bacterium]
MRPNWSVRNPAINQVAAIILTVVVLGATAGAEDLKWREYKNGRFGFVLSYPSTLIAGRVPENGAGREFHTADKAFSLSAQGHFFSPDSGNTFESNWNEELNTPGVTITYKKKAKDWYVVSGVTKEGTEYYHKLFAKRGNWVELAITYPHAQNAKYDKWVEQIVKRFVPFLEGDYDRVE